MRIISNSKGEYYHIIEEFKCPFNEKNDYIILLDGEVIYWQNPNNYYIDRKLNIELIREYINEIKETKWRSEIRKQKTLDYSIEILSKMISYERELKIDEVLRDENEYQYWLC